MIICLMFCTGVKIGLSYWERNVGSAGKMEKNEVGGTCGKYVGQDRCILGFGGETWGTETIWKIRLRWKDNIKMDLQEVGCGGMELIDRAQDNRDR